MKISGLRSGARLQTLPLAEMSVFRAAILYSAPSFRTYERYRFSFLALVLVFKTILLAQHAADVT
jgi:hypothetical protein